MSCNSANSLGRQTRRHRRGQRLPLARSACGFTSLQATGQTSDFLRRAHLRPEPRFELSLGLPTNPTSRFLHLHDRYQRWIGE